MLLRTTGLTPAIPLPDPGSPDNRPMVLPAACQPSLQRGVRGVPPRLMKKIKVASLPHSKGGPPLPGRRILLTREADTPYSKGGPPSPERWALLTRKAGPP